MRYHYEKPEIYRSHYGETYICDHPVYDRCTLFKIGDKGLAVIQQRFDPETKETRWTEIDPWLTDAIYLHPNFKSLFEKHSKKAGNSEARTYQTQHTLATRKGRMRTTDSTSESTSFLYPTMTVRQVMWALKMKPIKRERWETVFDRKDI